MGCGARSVGPPLARPEHQLPSYGRALLVTASGALLLVTFLSATVFALLEQDTFSLGFWTVVAAAETAAWRLKFMALPAALAAVWMGAALCRSIRREPGRFIGSRAAHAGLASSVLAASMMLTFIGVTVPERLRQRQRGIDAGILAEGYTIQRALLEYRARYGTYPTDMKDLRERLPDSDGRLAAALNSIDDRGYTPRADLAAALPKAKTRRGRPAQLRRAALDASTDDGSASDEKVSFTNYELRLPGEDKILNTEDDWLMRDGVILKSTASRQTAEQQQQPLRPVRKLN